MSLWFFLLTYPGLLLWYPTTSSTEAPSHNIYGGYIEACGQLPPLVGDDC
jgi:hypothetical protein